MKFMVDIPDELFWQVAARAERFEQRVPEYTADVLKAVSAHPGCCDSDPVVRLWRTGMADAEIGAYLGMTNLAVSDRRRHFKLRANPRAARRNT